MVTKAELLSYAEGMLDPVSVAIVASHPSDFLEILNGDGQGRSVELKVREMLESYAFMANGKARGRELSALAEAGYMSYLENESFVAAASLVWGFREKSAGSRSTGSQVSRR